MADTRRAHRLLDQLQPDQLAAVIQLLEVVTDPVGRSLANAPIEEQPITAEEAARLDAAHAAIQRGEGTPHEQILQEFGIFPKS